MSFSLQDIYKFFSKHVYEYRFFVFLFFVLLISLSIIGASTIVLKTSTDTYVDKDSKLYKELDLYQEEFYSESIAIMVEGQSATSPAVLKAMDRTESLVRSVPGVDRVISPSTIIRSINEKVTGQNKIPSTQEEVDNLLIYAPDTFSNLVFDETHSIILVQHGNLTDNQKTSILKAVRDSVDFAHFPPGYSVIITGESALLHDMSAEIMSSMTILLAVAIILMFLCLSLLFKNVRWRLYPLLVVLLGIVYTFGVMGFLDLKITMVAIAAFPILIGLGIDYAIQFQNRFEEEIRNNATGKDAFFTTVTNLGPAILTALIITIVSFLSLLTSSIPMVRGFGLLLIIGCLACYASAICFGTLSIYFLNALSKRLAQKKKINGKKYPLLSFFLPSSDTKINSGSSENFITRFLNKWIAFTIQHKKTILALALVTGVFGFYVDMSIPAETDYKNYIPQNMPALINYYHLNSVRGGDGEFNILLFTDDIASPSVLKWMDDFSSYEVDNQIYIQNASSLAHIVKDKNGGTIPDTRDEILDIYNSLPADTMNMYSRGSTLLLLNLGIGDAFSDLPMESIETLLSIIQDDITWTNPPPGVHITVTGSRVPFIELMESLLSGRVQQTAAGLLLVFLTLFIIYKDVYKALAPVIPMSVVIGWSGLVMGFFGIVYTPMTAVLGCMVLGVGAEYSILLMERYFEEKKRTDENLKAMREAVTSTGIALIVSGMTTIFGFMALLFSSFPIVSSFGVVTVINMLTTLLASFTIFPPLMLSFENIKGQGGLLSFIRKFTTHLKKELFGVLHHET